MISPVNKKHIMIVDDDRSVTRMLCMLLETRGYDVAIARSGKQAIREVSPDTDLILLDLILPDQEGFSVCRQLRQDDRTRNIPIIILSAKLLSGDICEGLYIGADDYLTKPFEYEELVARMEAVMRRGSSCVSSSSRYNSDDCIIAELRRIIDNELIVPYFQPIFRLDPFCIYGLEALSRPVTGSILSNPEVLFKSAIQYGFYQDLEFLAWKKAVAYAAEFIQDERLFLNCNPYMVEGPKFMTVKNIFDNMHIKTNKVVLEITERSAISDFAVFYEHLKEYREHGFEFAVDDVGGGYASIESIVETRPEIVKIDRHIVNGIHQDKFKKSIIKFILAFCKENNIFSIAEGIECKDDLDCVRELGVDAVQGYYLYKPNSKINRSEMLEVQELI